MKEPLISIVIPAYNEQDYIAETLKSAKRQTYDRLETIVVANNCSDNTAKVAREFATVVIETPTQGISKAKNLGAQNAQGNIIAFMDADSQMKDNLLEKVYTAVICGYDCGKSKIRSLDDDRTRAKIFCFYSEFLNRIAAPFSFADSGAGAFSFTTKKLFDILINQDGYFYQPDLKVMEDVNLMLRLKKHGTYKFITNSCLFTSMRRFIEEGYLKCFIEDSIHVLKPEGKTRRRWNPKNLNNFPTS